MAKLRGSTTCRYSMIGSAKGTGAALIDRTFAVAQALGFDALYLSTYRDVPWNGPYYTRRGFEEVPRAEWSRVLRLQFTIENSHGHPPWRRVIMQRKVGTTRARR